MTFRITKTFVMLSLWRSSSATITTNVYNYTNSYYHYYYY